MSTTASSKKYYVNIYSEKMSLFISQENNERHYHDISSLQNDNIFFCFFSFSSLLFVRAYTHFHEDCVVSAPNDLYSLFITAHELTSVCVQREIIF